MFTGLVEDVGSIAEIAPAPGGGARVSVRTRLPNQDLERGASIAVDGACLTVVERNNGTFSADVSVETLRRTTLSDRRPGDAVNLERPLALGERLGGHLVLGHVDGVGKVVRFEPAGKSRLLRVRVPADLARYIARKGSITVHGVSLTVNAVRGAEFEVNLIPHTLASTTLRHLEVGDRVNLEVDPLARYAERLLGKK